MLQRDTSVSQSVSDPLKASLQTSTDCEGDGSTTLWKHSDYSSAGASTSNLLADQNLKKMESSAASMTMSTSADLHICAANSSASASTLTTTSQAQPGGRANERASASASSSGQWPHSAWGLG